MPDYNVLGRNAIFNLLVSGNYFPIFCASVNGFDFAQADIETTNINSGANSEYVPGMGSGTFNVNGLTRLVNTDGRVNIVYLLQEAQRRKIHDIQLVMTDNIPNVETISFKAFITNTNITNDKSIFSTSSITFRITGGLTFATVVPDPTEPICEVQDPLYIDCVEGDDVVSDPLLIGSDVTILEVGRTGVQHDPTLGSPTGRRYRYQSSDGSLFFPASIPFSAGETIYVLYKKLV